MEPDYYAHLQVDPRAESEVIDAAYRRLASKYHPDRNSSTDANERMKLINAAYEVLSDPDRRAAYDLRRTISPREQPHQRPGASSEQTRFDWRTSLFLSAFVLAVTFMFPRFGLRGLLIVGVLFLVLWLIMRLRKT